MTIVSKLTAQGQISVPAEVRKKLGVGPGSTIEWEEKDGEIVVRRAGRHTSSELHAAVFKGANPKVRTLKELKDGVRAHVRRKHARD